MQDGRCPECRRLPQHPRQEPPTLLGQRPRALPERLLKCEQEGGRGSAAKDSGEPGGQEPGCTDHPGAASGSS